MTGRDRLHPLVVQHDATGQCGCDRPVAELALDIAAGSQYYLALLAPAIGTEPDTNERRTVRGIDQRLKLRRRRRSLIGQHELRDEVAIVGDDVRPLSASIYGTIELLDVVDDRRDRADTVERLHVSLQAVDPAQRRRLEDAVSRAGLDHDVEMIGPSQCAIDLAVGDVQRL